MRNSSLLTVLENLTRRTLSKRERRKTDSLRGAEPFLKSWLSLNWLRKFKTLIEPENILLCSQNNESSFYRDERWTKFSFFGIILKIFLLTAAWPSKKVFSASDFQTIMLYALPSLPSWYHNSYNILWRTYFTKLLIICSRVHMLFFL